MHRWETALIPQKLLVQVKEMNLGVIEQEIWKQKVVMVSIGICNFGSLAEKAFCKKGSEGTKCGGFVEM